ncbi:MAG: hypothetical protein IKY44_02175 [Clostridia bacterium]|nr:hypothetical protein [Clostridia bacterium]
MRKNGFIKILAALCAVVLLASCSSAPVTEGTTLPSQEHTQPSGPQPITADFRLGYNADSSLNPFEADTAANCAVTRLVYDSLFICDESFAPMAVVAEKYEKDGYVLTVTLRQGITFSDGSILTASDVSYSYSLAKGSDVYSDRLSGVAYITVVDDYTIRFVLNVDNPYIAACLDFPIIKNGSYQLPVGSGRYRYVMNTEGRFLMKNGSYSLGENGGFEVIELCDMATNDTIAYKVKNGELDFAYDNLSSGKAPSISSSSAVVPMSNMVFVGMNSASDLMSIQAIRNAVRSALDVGRITDGVYGAFADATDLPFHPSWYAGAKDYSFEGRTTLEYLSAIGYNRYNEDGLITNGWYTLDVKMIVNKENEQRVRLAQAVADSLIAKGINVSVVKLSFKDYKTALQNGEYDLYIGEVKLTNDMSLAEIFGGYVYYQTTNSFGIDRNNESRNAYNQLMAGEIDMESFCDVFMSSCPFVPVCFRSGAAIFSRNLGGTGNLFAGDIFYGISGWTMS